MAESVQRESADGDVGHDEADEEGPPGEAWFFLDEDHNSSDRERMEAVETTEHQHLGWEETVDHVFLSPDLPLGHFFPYFFDSGESIVALELNHRSMNVLSRNNIKTLTDLAALSARDISDFRNAGAGTVKDIIHACARLSHSQVLTNSDAALNSPATQPYVAPPGVSEMLEQAQILAKWHFLRGYPQSAIWDEDGLQGAPERVKIAYQRLCSVSAEDVIAGKPSSPANTLNALLDGGDDRTRSILAQRFFADDAVTLDALGHQMGVTRERVRQIEKEALSNLRSRLKRESEDLSELAFAIRQRIGRVSSLERLLIEYPSLSESVYHVDEPAWRVLDRLDDTFEISDGWAAVPSVIAVANDCKEICRREADDLGLVDLTRLVDYVGLVGQEREAEFLSWLDYLDIEVFRGRGVVAATSIPDWAAIVLSTEGQPLSIEEIASQLPVSRAERSIRNALATDSRFSRVDRDLFALSSWGLNSYGGIREAIGEYLDEHDGAAPVTQLVDNLTSRFDVAETSVRAYASGFPFNVVDGVVRRSEKSTARQGRLQYAKRTYAHPDGLYFRFLVTSEHLRGSGSVLPSDLARLLDLHEGDSITLPSTVGEQSLYWTGLQPGLGSVRRFLEEVEEGEELWVFAKFLADGSFDLVRANLDGKSGLDLALAMVGWEQEDSADAQQTFTKMLGLPEGSTWASIVLTLEKRGEEDLARVLVEDERVAISGRSVDDSERTSDERAVVIDEILDLL